jgi:integrase
VTVVKTAQGRFKGIWKKGRDYGGSKVFDRRKDAAQWVIDQRKKYAGVMDMKAGNRLISEVLAEYLNDYRQSMVAESTYRNETYIFGAMTPDWVKRRTIASFTSNDVTRLLADMLKSGKYGTMQRYRSSLSPFFAWTVRMGYRPDNPVTGALMPRRTEPQQEMKPFTLEELNACYQVWHDLNPVDADIVLFLCHTGLRWGEARALFVGDFLDDGSYPHLVVSRSRPEGCKTRTTKAGKSRMVPISAAIEPFVRGRIEGRKPDELLMPPMHRTRLMQQLDWKNTAGGRRLHDCRHTACCLFLQAGVDVASLRQIAGHSSLAVTSRYVHWLGADADRRSLDKFNEFLHGGTTGVLQSKNDGKGETR